VKVLESNSKVIPEAFSNLGVEEISNVGSETFDSMIQIFKSYPNKFFTQKDFVKGLNKSNPYVNKILRKLVENKVILKSKGNGRYYYRLIVRK